MKCDKCILTNCPIMDMLGQAGCDSWWKLRETGERTIGELPRSFDTEEQIQIYNLVNACPHRLSKETCSCSANCSIGKNNLENGVSYDRCYTCMANNENGVKRKKCDSCPFGQDERECWAQTQPIRICRQTNKADIYNEEIVKLIIHNTDFPDLKKQASSFINSAIKFMGTGGKKTESDKLEERRKICEACPFNYGGRCKKCGCSIEIKTSWDSEKCPEDKW